MADLHALDENVREFAARVGDDYRAFEERYEGAVPRSVKEFGAKGDGVTDDSTAFQLAINAVGDGVVIVPPGIYMIRDLQITRGTLFDCQAGPSEVTTLAGGSVGTAVSLRYNGAGGAGSRIMTFRAPADGQWLKGGGILGRPHISGQNLCELLISAVSMHGGRFSIEMSRATFAGMSLNGQNGVLTQFCEVDFKYVWGAQPSTENSHGLIMNGNAPGTVDFVGCTQNYIYSNGAVKNGDMVRMVGHCDNNHLWLHGTQGLGAGKGTGRTLAIMQGNEGVAGRNNHVHYACGSIFLQTNSFGTHFDFLTSEGMTISGGGQFTFSHLVDYSTGETFHSKMQPACEHFFIPASAFNSSGAAVREILPGTSVFGIRMPDAATSGAQYLIHNPNWPPGVLASIEPVIRGGGATGDVYFELGLTEFLNGAGQVEDIALAHTVSLTGTTASAYPKVTARTWYRGQYLGLEVRRIGALAGDTLAASVHLLGVNIRIDFNGPTSLEAPLPPWRRDKNT